MEEPQYLQLDKLVSNTDWCRISKYSNAHLKRQTKIIAMQFLEPKVPVFFGSTDVQRVNNN